MVMFFLSLAAVVAATQTVRANDQDAGAAIRRGNLHYAKGEYEAAIAEYERVTNDAGESYARSLYNIGVCYYELWRTEEAITFYRQAIAARQGRYPGALYALGVALEDLKRLPEAQKAYQLSIAAAGGRQAPAHYRLGLLAAFARDYETAAELFRKAIVLSADHLPANSGEPSERPGWGACHNNLGVVLALTGRLNEAKREFEKALSQSQGRLTEAVANLKLCRARLASPGAAQLTSLQFSETATRNLSELP